MNKLLPLAIGMCVLISGCNSTPNYRKISENEIPSFKTKLQPSEELIYSSQWKQPTNKKEKCEILMEGYAPETQDKQPYSITWDGECDNGKASGLGKMVANIGAVESFEIGYVEGGISKQYYYSGVHGANNIKFGQYKREAGKPLKTLDNYATVKDNGEVDFLYVSGEADNETGITVGTNYKKYNNGTAKHTGYFGNNYFFGAVESYDTNSINTTNAWGYINTSTDKPDGFVVLKSSQGLWHQRYEYGSVQEYVQLPNSYICLLYTSDAADE